MKAALNGVPHLSILDGWWIEGFNGRNGWAYGRTKVEGDRDPADAYTIYQILEKEIISLYYKVSDDGVPHDWVGVMKESITLNPALDRTLLPLMENTFWTALGASSLAAIVTTIGIYVIRRFECWGRKNSIYFICFAAGVLISVSFLHIIPKSFSMNPNAHIYLFAGYLCLHLFYLSLT